MNENLQEIIEKIMSAVDIINEYGNYVDAYVKEQKNPLYGVDLFGGIGTAIQKKLIFEENKALYMKILDNAIKKFTRGDILLELQEPLHNLGVDINDYIDNLNPETIKLFINEAVKNVDKDTIINIAKQYQMARK